jgi:hypothetical protein
MCTTKRLTATAFVLNTAALSLLVIFAAKTARAQETPTPTPTPAPASSPTPSPTLAPTPTAVATPAERPLLKTIKLNVQYGSKVPVARKSFYLSRLPFNLDELQQKLGNLPSHKDYLRRVSGQGLSEELVAEFIREWLERYRCETVYCQFITREDVARIRLFQEAYKRASGVFKNARDEDGAETALKWLPNFLPREITTGYFDLKMDWVKRALALMEAGSIGAERNSIRAVMTDRKGEAYITEIAPGATYYISNLVPIEDGKDCFLWNTKKEVKVGPGVEVGVILGPNTKAKEVRGANAAALTFTCAPPK